MFLALSQENIITVFKEKHSMHCFRITKKKFWPLIIFSSETYFQFSCNIYIKPKQTPMDCQTSELYLSTVSQALSSSGQDRYGATGESPAKGYYDCKRPETPLPQGKAERSDTAWPGEEKTQGRNLSETLGGKVQTGQSQDLLSSFQWQHKMQKAQTETRLCLNMRKPFFTVRVSEHWHSLSRDIRSLYAQIFQTHLDTVLGNWP